MIIGGGAIVTVDLVVVPPFLLVCGLYVHIYLVLKKEIIFFNLKEKKKNKMSISCYITNYNKKNKHSYIN